MDDNEKILQTELLQEIEKHEKRVVDAIDLLTKRTEKELPAEIEKAAIVISAATEELKKLSQESDKNQQAHEQVIYEMVDKIKAVPETFKVGNWPESMEVKLLEKPDWWEEPPVPPEAVDIKSPVKIDNWPKYPTEFDLKKPKWWKEPKETDFKDLKGHLTHLFKGLWEATKQATQKVKVTNQGPDEVLPVILYTPEGEPYTVLSHGGSGGGGGSSTTALTNNLTLKTAAIDVSSSGANEVIAAVTGKRIKVYAVKFNVASTVSAKWVDGSTDLEGAMPYGAREGHTESVTPPMFLFQTTAGAALNLNLSSGVATTGRVSYWEE